MHRGLLSIIVIFGLGALASLAGCVGDEPAPSVAPTRSADLATPPAATTVGPRGTEMMTGGPTPTAPVEPTATATARATASARPTHTQRSSATPSPAPQATAAPGPTAGPTASPTVELTSIGSIAADWLGREVTVEGRIAEARSFSEGFSFTLDDGAGRIVLLMWHEVYDDCWDSAGINLGATVRARGEVSEYEGRLQIEPRFGGDVRAVRPAVAQAAQREIGSLSPADEGARVMIEGEVERTEGLPSAVKVFLRQDGAAAGGEVVVFIWRNVLDRIENNVGLGTPGSRVRVVGRVQVYRSNLEVVPALPADVTVLEIP